MDGVNMQETFFLFRSCVRRSKRVSKTQTAGREGHELQTGYLDCVQQMPSERRASRVDSGMTTATDQKISFKMHGFVMAVLLFTQMACHI
jgi:hypothetical protein